MQNLHTMASYTRDNKLRLMSKHTIIQHPQPPPTHTHTPPPPPHPPPPHRVTDPLDFNPWVVVVNCGAENALRGFEISMF